MTNLERMKRLSAKEFVEWLFWFEQESRKPEPIWCIKRSCIDTNRDCKVCIAEWFDEEVKE